MWFYTEKYVQHHINTCNLTPSPTDAPKNVTLSVNPSGDVVKGNSVTLTCSCSANPPVLAYTLYKESGQPLATLTPSQSHTIRSISLTDSGGYYCQAQNEVSVVKSNVTSLNVQCEYSRLN